VHWYVAHIFKTKNSTAEFELFKKLELWILQKNLPTKQFYLEASTYCIISKNINALGHLIKNNKVTLSGDSVTMLCKFDNQTIAQELINSNFILNDEQLQTIEDMSISCNTGAATMLQIYAQQQTLDRKTLQYKIEPKHTSKSKI